MKSKGLQKTILSKCQNGDTPIENHRDLSSGIGLRAIKRWSQVIHQSGSTLLSTPSGCPLFVRTKNSIQKIKYYRLVEKF